MRKTSQPLPHCQCGSGWLVFRLSLTTGIIAKMATGHSIKELATLTYGDTTGIVSSIEFDKDGEFFAVAGVTKKIKVMSVRCVL